MRECSITPGLRNEFHAGFQQAFGKYLVISGEYMWKYTHNAYDFSILGNTPITYPIEWNNSKIPGYMLRASVPDFHGFTAYCGGSSVAAASSRRKSRDRRHAGSGAEYSASTTTRSSIRPRTCNISPGSADRGSASTGAMTADWWPARYPAREATAATGPNGRPDSIVDVSGITPDQQFEAGLFCGSV